MKRTLTGIAAAAMVLGTVAPAAFAATTASFTSGGGKSISLDGTTLYNGVQVGNAKDAGTTTTYFPIWYLQQALTKAGYTQSYNVSTHQWDITVSGVDASNLTIPGGVGVGNASISINGTVVKKFNAQWAKDLAGGPNAQVTTYFPIYYLSNVLSAVGLSGAWDGNSFGLKHNATLAIAGNNSVAVGGKDTLSVTANGQTVTGATWSVDGNGGAVIDPNTGVFTANAAGTYNVTATYNGQTVTGKVVVYGAAAAVKISAPTSLVANGASTATVTATVVDAGGNAVSNFSGSAVLHFDSTNGAFAFVPSTDTTPAYGDGHVGTGDQIVKFSGGSATFTVIAGTTPGISDKIELQSLQDSNAVAVSGYTAPTASVSTTAQVATAVSVTVQNKQQYLPVNDNTGKAVFVVQVNDQTGNKMLGGTYSLTAAITGGGTFTDGTTSDKVVVVSGGNAQNVEVDGVQGKTGTYTFTASGNGLTSGSASVAAEVSGNAAKLALANANPEFTQNDGAGTTYTLSATDANGVPVNLPNTVTPKVTVTDQNGNAVSGVTVNGTPVDSTGSVTLAVYTTSILIKDPTMTSGDAGTYHVTVSDVETNNPLASVSSSYKEDAGTTVAQLAMTPGSTVLNGSSATTALSVQAEDFFGNPIAAPSSQTVTFSVYSGGPGAATINGSSNPVTVSFDSNGKATATFAAQNYDNASWVVKASTTINGNAVSASKTIYITDHPVAGFSFKLQDTQGSGSYNNSYTYAQAGDKVTLNTQLASAATDANGNSVSANNDPVTLVINHASGLTGIPTTGSGVTVTTSSTNDTATLTGTLSAVSTAVYNATFRAATAGTVTLALTDNSSNATGSSSIQVVAGTAIAAVGIPTFSSATTVTKNSTTAFTIQLVDAGGNPVVASTDTTVNLTVYGLSGVTFQDANHLPATSLTVKAGTSSATGYLVTGAATSGTVTGTVYGGAADGDHGTSATITVQ